MGGRAFRTQVPTDTEIFKTNVAENLPPLELFIAADVKADADARFAFAPGWSALRLLNNDVIRRSGGKEWESVVRVKDEKGQDQFLLLVFQFEKPLPELDQWPTTAALHLR
jgi:hypothetical protein